MGETKSVASETDVPKGLDVVPMEPGTIVGSRDLQGTDGTTRTDRPGEILGTPVVAPANAKRAEASATLQAAKGDHMIAAVDKANREELPRLGGPIEDNWEPSDAKPSKAAQAKADADAKALAALPRTTAAIAPSKAEAAPAKTTDSGIKVSPKIDRG